MIRALIFLAIILACIVLIVLLNHDKTKCKKCKQPMLKCGFGKPGGIFGNGRYECRNEACEVNQLRNKSRKENK